MRHSFLGGFLLAAIGWLVVCLLAWYPASPYLALPVSWLCGLVVAHGFPAWADGVDLANTNLSLLTRLDVTMAAMASGQVATLAPEVDYRHYGFGLPLLAALLFAGRAKRPARKLLMGAFCLMPFQVWGICFDWLKQVALDAGTGLYWSSRLGGVQRELIAWGYQIGYLVLPTLVPVLLWLVMDRKFASTMLLEATLDNASPRVDDDPR